MTETAHAPCEIRGRLAPSPTGFLHLGNAWAFLLAWLSARARGGELVLFGLLVSCVFPIFVWLSAFVGAGLIYAGLTGVCGMAKLLAKMPWNKK